MGTVSDCPLSYREEAMRREPIDALNKRLNPTMWYKKPSFVPYTAIVLGGCQGGCING